ncbi:hypothetical protein C7N43_12060 [Sphingobacteriales bacterium UPWRP_1]|nr:hypothetical protein BVG80_06030 [Sphingobacteriales bacterium TSM_CSM]PSJ76760.1 hypothetical protein C7N43_12060 [Sphingobacteriales bacterium UPWRP_1]
MPDNSVFCKKFRNLTQSYKTLIMGVYTEVIIICLMGILGGFAYSLQTGILTLPHRDSKNSLNLGFLANCIFGIVGAVVIFLIVPGDFDFSSPQKSDFIKSVATALIGGWGGLTLIEKVFSSQFTELEKKLKEKEEQEKTDVKVLETANQYLNSSSSVQMPERDLQELIKTASPAVKATILNEAQRLRSENWNNNKPKMERTIPVFEAISEAPPTEEKNHQVFGQLGFALKDKSIPDYRAAKENLDKAIELRNNANENGFAWYEFNRAICNIHLDNNFKRQTTAEPNLHQQITADLRIAFSDNLLLERLEKNASLSGGDADILTIKQWLDVNKVKGELVGIGWLDAAV